MKSRRFHIWSILVVVAFIGVAAILVSCIQRGTPAVKATPSSAVATPVPLQTPRGSPTPTATSTTIPVVKPKPSGDLSLALSYLGTEVLDPSLGPVSATKPTLWPLYDYLVGATPDGKLSEKTGIANKWEASNTAAGSVYTFYLRQGVKFHNGDEVTAEDVKFSIEYYGRPAATMGATGFLKETIDRIEVPEPYKMVVYTKKPYGGLLYDFSPLSVGMATMVLPKKYIQEKGEQNFRRNPVGSGPYRFKEYVPGSHIQFEAVDNHWLVGVPKYKTLALNAVPEETTRIAMLKTGQADVIDISQEKVKELRSAGFNIFFKPGATVVIVRLYNTWQADTYLHDIRVREALNLAINRQEILTNLFAGLGKVTGNTDRFSSWHLAYEPQPLYPYDPGRAKQLLKEAFPGGVELTINSFDRPGADLRRLNEAISRMWNDAGIKTKIVPMDYSAHRSKWGKGELPNVVSAFSSSNNYVAGAALYNAWHSKGMLTSAKMPTLDGLIGAASAKVDQIDAAQSEVQVFRFMRENHLVVPLVELDSAVAANPKKVTQWDLGKLYYDDNYLALIGQEK